MIARTAVIRSTPRLTLTVVEVCGSSGRERGRGMGRMAYDARFAAAQAAQARVRDASAERPSLDQPGQSRFGAFLALPTGTPEPPWYTYWSKRCISMHQTTCARKNKIAKTNPFPFPDTAVPPLRYSNHDAATCSGCSTERSGARRECPAPFLSGGRTCPHTADGMEQLGFLRLDNH